MKDYAQYFNSLSEEKKERFFARYFKVAYRDSIDEMSADEIKKKTKEFRFKWSNTELDEKSVDKMFALMADSQELEKKISELKDMIFHNLVKTVDLVRKANLRHRE